MPKTKPITEERILSIANDISEDIYDTFTKAECIEVVRYFQKEFDALWRSRLSERGEISVEILKFASDLMNPTGKPKYSKMINIPKADGGFTKVILNHNPTKDEL